MRQSGATILNAVREQMRRCALKALIVPSSDAHNSEYVAEHLQYRAFLTNFRGSAGTAVVTLDDALLWTDGRYWLEAAATLFSEFQLMKQGEPGVATIEEWIDSHLDAGSPVGLNPAVCTVAEWARLSKVIALRPVEDIFAALVPSSGPCKPLFVRPQQFCGATCRERRDALVAELHKRQCNIMILSALDEVAWLTNLRGRDVPCNPVFYAYAVVDRASPAVRVFIDERKVTEEVRAARAGDVVFCPYSSFFEFLSALPEGLTALVDVRQTSEAVYRQLQARQLRIKPVVCGPAQQLKAIKNPVELQGFKDCHIRDGAALTRYLAWLYKTIALDNHTALSEFDAAAELEALRGANKYFEQLSFPTISSTGANAAIVHYAPPPTGSAMIQKHQLYLVDSGAQYLDGTTDVTRTVCFTTPRAVEREAYTLVLKGHIALDRAVFPKATLGQRLDCYARSALWQVGLDYSHGTGHGVGSFLNVHEGPQGIGPRVNPTEATMDLHMIISNEPGYYKDGAFGIRIENLEEVVQRPTKYSADGFLGFSPLTLVPLCRELIDAHLLTQQEREWVDAYHAKVQSALLPSLEAAKDNFAVQYLMHHTQPL